MENENDDMLCTSCNEHIESISKHASCEGLTWHEDCFVCSHCADNLVEVLFALNDQNKLFCVKCFDDKYGVMCSTCQTFIKLGDEKFKHGDLVWHRKCFICQNCHNSLDPKSFWIHDKLNYCKDCYGQLFTEICQKCQEKIWKNCIKFRDFNLHTQCFACNKCGLEISEKRFFYKTDLLFCENCHNENFCKKCASCDEYITGLNGEEMISSNNENWHTKCFICYKCKDSLVGLSFVGKGNQIFCPGCFK